MSIKKKKEGHKLCYEQFMWAGGLMGEEPEAGEAKGKTGGNIT